MESEEVLTSIMTKLKEYKANPLSSPDEEKGRQKNLMKMFCIYTSLKKREKARQKQEEHSATIHEEKDVENQLNSLNNCDQNNEIEPCDSDRISSNNSPEDITADELRKDEIFGDLLEDESGEICRDFSPINQECIKNERVFDESEESIDENTEEHENSLNQFLLQLSERLKRLPYRQRSKLEIEFFRRLIEVEECLGSFGSEKK